jgi:hypothetical protein
MKKYRIWMLLPIPLLMACSFSDMIKTAAESAAVKAVDHAGDKLTDYADRKHAELKTEIPEAVSKTIETKIAPQIAAEYIKVQEEEEGPLASMKAWLLLAILSFLIGKGPANALITKLRTKPNTE